MRTSTLTAAALDACPANRTIGLALWTVRRIWTAAVETVRAEIASPRAVSVEYVQTVHPVSVTVIDPPAPSYAPETVSLTINLDGYEVVGAEAFHVEPKKPTRRKPKATPLTPSEIEAITAAIPYGVTWEPKAVPMTTAAQRRPAREYAAKVKTETVAQLRERCKTAGIKTTTKMTKAQLQEALLTWAMA